MALIRRCLLVLPVMLRLDRRMVELLMWLRSRPSRWLVGCSRTRVVLRKRRCCL